MTNDTLRTRHVIVAGGGPAAVEGALALQRLAGDRVAITLVSPEPALVYRPLAVAEPFGLGTVRRYSLERLTEERGFEHVRGAVAAVDSPQRELELSGGMRLAYDALLLATGAQPQQAVPGALTFRGPEDASALRVALKALHPGSPLRVAFVAGAETAWTLPLYELALMTARWAEEQGLALESWLVTHEDRALGVFGVEASASVAELLEDAGVRLWTGAFAEDVDDGRLWLSMEGGMPVDLVVALPRLVGPSLPGLPADTRGFVPVDAYGRVPGAPGVYAAGDVTTRPLKQGGLATQQADAAASAIAADLGMPVTAQPYRPILRGLLLTGGRPRYLLHAPGDAGTAAEESPWWPPHKIAGRELAPYLAAHPELAEAPGVAA